MAIAEKAGLIKALGKGLSPIMTKLFPEVLADHLAMGAMIMNIVANILGLGNAATYIAWNTTIWIYKESKSI